MKNRTYINKMYSSCKYSIFLFIKLLFSILTQEYLLIDRNKSFNNMETIIKKSIYDDNNLNKKTAYFS